VSTRVGGSQANKQVGALACDGQRPSTVKNTGVARWTGLPLEWEVLLVGLKPKREIVVEDRVKYERLFRCGRGGVN